MKLISALSVMACVFVASGCSLKRIYQGVYEGAQVRDQLQATPSERIGKPEPPDYQQYERERVERSSRKATTVTQ